ncbi:response regulator [Candidatus Roizmanbacteria bacterium]|nr:response regulator [Candidatus Roizmanbacteria bacterium]
MDDNTREAGPANQEVEANKKLNILLVEDEPMITMLIEDVLAYHNITSFTAAEKALDELRKAKGVGSSFDWVITDKGLEGKMDGFGLADLIKNEKLGNPYVTLLTGSAAVIEKENTPEELKDKGIDHLMGKPFKLEELEDSVKTVRKFIEQSQSPQT